MRILRNIIITLLLMGLAAVSTVGAMIELPKMWAWEPTRINALGRSFLTVMRPGNMLLWIWIGIALSCVLVLLMTIVRPRKQMRIEVQMGGGKVVIMDSAIKRYLRSALAEIPAVTVRRIDLKDTRGGVLTDIYADVKTHENLPVLERRMIQRVRAALAEDLGITGIADVHVFIRDFEVTGRQSAAARHAQARESEPAGSHPDPAPTGATGPFDQVPYRPGANTSFSPTEAAARVVPDDSKMSQRFFTLGTDKPEQKDETDAHPRTARPVEITHLPPSDTPSSSQETPTATVFTVGAPAPTAARVIEDTRETKTPGSSISDIVAGSANITPVRRKGLFGLWSKEDSSAPSSGSGPAIVETSEIANADYKPSTATESSKPTDSSDSSNADKTLDATREKES